MTSPIALDACAVASFRNGRSTVPLPSSVRLSSTKMTRRPAAASGMERSERRAAKVTARTAIRVWYNRAGGNRIAWRRDDRDIPAAGRFIVLGAGRGAPDRAAPHQREESDGEPSGEAEAEPLLALLPRADPAAAADLPRHARDLCRAARHLPRPDRAGSERVLLRGGVHLRRRPPHQ